MSQFLDVRKEKDWKKAVEVERENISSIAKEEELGFNVVTLWCKEDPASENRWVIPRPVCIFALFNGESPAEIERCKDNFANETRIMTVAGDAIAMTTSSEAWMARVSKEEVENQKEGARMKPPSERADRTEALIVIANHRSYPQQFWHRPITHPGGERTLGDWTCDEHEGAEGRLVFNAMPHIVPQRKALKALAKELLKIHEERGIGLWKRG